MNKELKTIFRTIKDERRGGAPHENWVSRNKDILMMQVRNTTDEKAKHTFGEYTHHFFGTFVPMEQVRVCARAVGVFAITAGIVLSGGIATAQVYRDTVPGDMLYGFKLAVEKTQMVLAPNDEYRMRLHTEFADRRMDEIARLADGSVLQQQLVPSALVKFEREIVALQTGLDEMHAEHPGGVLETAKLIERKMVVYHNTLRKVSAQVPVSVYTPVAMTGNLIDDVMVGALAIIVERHLEGDETVPRTVLVSKFESRLKQAEEMLEGSPDAEEGTETASASVQAKRAITAAKTLIEEEKYQAALTKIVEVAELTKEAEAAEGEGSDSPCRGLTPTDGSDLEECDETAEEGSEGSDTFLEGSDPATDEGPAGSSDDGSDDAVGSGVR